MILLMSLICFFRCIEKLIEPEFYLNTLVGGHEECSQDLEAPQSDLFLFPDESGNLTQELSPTYPVLHSPLITPVPNLALETDDFCILETPGARTEVNKLCHRHSFCRGQC